MDVRIVCEGSTDWTVLEVVVRAALGDAQTTVAIVQPDFDALRSKTPDVLATGWTGVRAYLRGGGAQVAAEHCDTFVVQVDADIRTRPQIAEAVGGQPDPAGLDSLCDHVKGWFAGGVPASVVIVLPREATEAWLLAVHTRIVDVESIFDPARELVARGLIGGEQHVPAKGEIAYRKLAAPLARVVGDRKALARVPELERFVGKLRQAERRVRKAKKQERLVRRVMEE